ncbi:hypothetical protein [Paenibacillus sp. MMS20-IR301]|uniref:hypothetical protein n=1 Tax=Paenibacillus sp. MMS20-IR301 TaxID=2895946 RepID=UPI0028ED102B|nr:hypothetical protein [Paenibacillus sp. MMS20-IR301]WNS40767.1 hypothetical protein LOS79_17050 [Paenibacillus sp. MMS20-IR301]
MKLLLKADIYRVWKNKRLLLITLAVICIAAVLVKTAGEQTPVAVILQGMKSGTLVLPVMFIPVYLFTWQTDFTSRTVNNVLVSGVSRKCYFAGKLILTYILGTVFVVAYSCTICLTAYLLLGAYDPGEVILPLILQTILYEIVLSLGFMIYTLMRAAALPTALYLLLVLLGENLLSLLMHQLNLDAGRLSPYWLFRNLSRVLGIAELSRPDWIQMAIGGVVIWLVTVAWSWISFAGEELK